MIPRHYPVTMIDPAGREYDVHDAAGYVGARFRRGHEAKPKPEPKPIPAPSVPPPAVAPKKENITGSDSAART